MTIWRIKDTARGYDLITPAGVVSVSDPSEAETIKAAIKTARAIGATIAEYVEYVIFSEAEELESWKNSQPI